MSPCFAPKLQCLLSVTLEVQTKILSSQNSPLNSVCLGHLMLEGKIVSASDHCMIYSADRK